MIYVPVTLYILNIQFITLLPHPPPPPCLSVCVSVCFAHTHRDLGKASSQMAIEPICKLVYAASQITFSLSSFPPFSFITPQRG